MISSLPQIGQTNKRCDKGLFSTFIIGTPTVLPPSSLAATGYDRSNGTPVKVLTAVNSHSSISRMNLVRGNYILLGVGTWLPRSEHVSGYAIYKFVVKVFL